MAELPPEFKEHEGKADADAGEKLDKVLAALDSMSKRMDAIEECDKAKADAAKADAEKCADEGKVWEYIGTVFDANRNRGYHVHEKVDAPKPVEGTGDEKNPPALPPKPNHKK